MILLHTIMRRLSKLHLICLVAAMCFAVLSVGGAWAAIAAYEDGTARLPADCALVFGAAVYGKDLPGPAVLRRVSEAAQRYREGSVRRIILSGGEGRGIRVSEAEVMRNLAERMGVKPKDMMMETMSRSTWENIRNARPLTEGCSSVVGISDGYHLARIEYLSWRQGWGSLSTFPVRERPPVLSERRSKAREVLALLYYALYLDVLIPL